MNGWGSEEVILFGLVVYVEFLMSASNLCFNDSPSLVGVGRSWLLSGICLKKSYLLPIFIWWSGWARLFSRTSQSPVRDRRARNGTMINQWAESPSGDDNSHTMKKWRENHHRLEDIDRFMWGKRVSEGSGWAFISDLSLFRAWKFDLFGFQ